MLTPNEQIAFILLVVVCGILAFQGFKRIFKTVRSGADAYRSDNLIGRFITALVDVFLQKSIKKAPHCFTISFIHFLCLQFLSAGKCE
tara:strand:- start:815 stop:1078 length:264 start_codon:yes stop_codon:yes gene_type:complete